MPKDVHWERKRARDEVIRAALELERTGTEAAVKAVQFAAREYRAAVNTAEVLD